MKSYQLIILTMIMVSSAVARQRLFKDDLSDYDPVAFSANYTSKRTESAIIKQIGISRGNDDPQQNNEGSYETAMMPLNLIIDKTPGTAANKQEYFIRFDFLASLSTREASHARGVRGYTVRSGTQLRQNNFDYISYNRINTAQISFLDKEYEQRLFKGVYDANSGKWVQSQEDATGRWIWAQVAIGTVDLSKDQVYAGMLFIQKSINELNPTVYASNGEFNDSVKHKVFWTVEVKNQAIGKITLRAEQPSVLGNNPNRIKTYLRTVKQCMFVNQKWDCQDTDEKRFRTKTYH